MRVINRFLSQYDRYAVIKARYGERIARQTTKTFGSGSPVERPLQRVEVDNTPLDILVIDERTGLVLGRPWITVMIDKYSRMIIGYYLSFRKPSAESVLRCLRHAILPKTYVHDRYPEIGGEWLCYGLIEDLYCDNGLEFHAKDLEAACASLGIHVIYCPTRSPHLKGTIERFLKTLNYGLLHKLPGTTFAKYDKRADYDTVGRAALTFQQLEEILHRWMIDVYFVDFHRGINTAPIQRWLEGVRLHPPRLPPSVDHLKVYLGKVERRVITKNGIDLHGLQYDSDAISDLYARYPKQEFTVRTDLDNIETIYVLDEEKKIYLEATCTTPGYAKGLTIEQHKSIQKKGREDYKNLPYRDQLLAGKAALQQLSSEILNWTKPKVKQPGNREIQNKVQKKILQDEVMLRSTVNAAQPQSADIEKAHAEIETDLFDFDFPNFDVESREAIY